MRTAAQQLLHEYPQAAGNRIHDYNPACRCNAEQATKRILAHAHKLGSTYWPGGVTCKKYPKAVPKNFQRAFAVLHRHVVKVSETSKAHEIGTLLEASQQLHSKMNSLMAIDLKMALHAWYVHWCKAEPVLRNNTLASQDFYGIDSSESDTES